MAAHVIFGSDGSDLRKTVSADSPGVASDHNGQPHGIYNLRSVRRGSSNLHRRSGASLRRAVTTDAEDDDSGLRQAGDYKTKQIFHGTQLMYLAYQSIGVIYGDIGTSPLYCFSGIFSEAPSNADLVGALSLILWSLIMMVTVKYILIILHADNEGEGGTFSTYSLISRYANITERDPREASLIKMERHGTNEFRRTNRGFRALIEKSSVAKILLKTMGVLAVTMVMSDGVLTPAQSVLGAVQGLSVIAPNITNATIVGVTCAILILLFLIQPFGTSKIANFFAPIVMFWLAWNAVFGIYNLAKFDWTVLRAFNPGLAFQFLIRNKERGWRQLGGVLLCFTGVEALFADLGAFSMRAIQISWLCYTLPCLFLAYLGQAAYISVHPDAYSNPFYNSVPPGTLIPSLIFAILAAIVASQAIITATFQLLAQIMKLSYFPQIKVVHTSTVFYGQVYVPMLNWLLMIGTVLIAAIYNNTTSLGNAYGVCVIFVSAFDTIMVSMVAILKWKFPPLLVLFPYLIIASMDGAFLSSALTKVPQGAWFTLALAAVLACLLILWRFGKENQWRAEAADRFPTSHIVKQSPDGHVELTTAFGGGQISSIKGFGIFFDKAGEKTPIVFSQFLSKLMAVTDVAVFFHLRPLETPSVPLEDRYTVSRLAIPNCYRLVVRHGFNDEVITPDLGGLVAQQIRDFIIRDNQPRISVNRYPPTFPSSTERGTDDGGVEETGAGKDVNSDNSNGSSEIPKVTISSPVSITPWRPTAAAADSEKFVRSRSDEVEITSDDTVSSDLSVKMRTELQDLEEACARQVLYIVGKEQLRVREDATFLRKIILGTFLWIRENTRTKIANLRVPIEKVVEVGFVKDM